MDQSERRSYLEQVLIGGLEKRKVVIVDYDPGWVARFEVESDRVRRALGAAALRVEHVGSTAVPGLAAKPIIDLVVTVADMENEDLVVPGLESAGYELRVREPGHLMFRTVERDVHVHVWADSDREVSRVLRFRDRLRESPADLAAYERLKRQLATREWADGNEYADAKGPLIEAILAKVGYESGRGSTELT